MRLLCVIAVSATTACGPGATGGGAQPPRPSNARPQTSDLGPQPGVRPQASEQQSVAEDRCNKLIDHVVTLAIAERPAEQKISDDERTKIASQLRTSWRTKCDAITEPGYRCAIDAPTLAALDRCGG